MYVIGYPKSGNTWLSYLLAYCLNAEYDDVQAPGVHPKRATVRRYVKGNLPHPSYQAQFGQVLKTHALQIDNLNNEPVIYLVRDGRDVMVSYYYFLKIFSRRSPSHKCKNDFRTRIHHQLGRLIRRPKGSDFSVFVRQYAKDWAHHIKTWTIRNPTALVRYEDLYEFPEKTLRDLMSTLGTQISLQIIQEAVERFSFQQLSGRQPGHENLEAFFRKGIVGDWKNHFSSRDAAYFQAEAGDILEKLGYSGTKQN